MHHRYVFLGGLHRSATSVLARELARHPDVAGLVDTGVPEDEGQHLQDVYPTARAHGGPGRFGFDPDAHLTETSPLVRPGARQQIEASWESWWSSPAPVRVEKSPPNLIRTRFLQALFPEASFVLLLRHPAAVTMATAKWRPLTPLRRLVEHWLRCHEILAGDLPHLQRAVVVRYEDLVADPRGVLAGIWRFLDLPGTPEPAEIRGGSDERYFRMWRERGRGPLGRWARGRWVAELEPRIRRFGYSLTDLEEKSAGAALRIPPTVPPQPRPGA